MQKLVVDSSVIVKWLNKTNEKCIEQSDQIIKEAQGGIVTLLAPELSKYEIGNVFLFSKKLSINKAVISLAGLYLLPIEFIGQSEALANETYQIAQTNNITFYDASFLALAQQEKATLVTDNPKHQKRVKGIKVVALKNYR